ncbi:MAG: hypothetical protein NZ651_01145 [Candidatus Bipolaricaulota bacterium]|nr:hypothetical protein [Candidatus Bipolaricaulota bacterium]MDW8126374.1 hypothetical protein [Candidatus Bipolaricaulota bacterium]
MAGVTVVLAASLWPLPKAGIPSVLRHALGTLPGAIAEYPRLAGKQEIFLSGTFVDAVSSLRVEEEWLTVMDYCGGSLCVRVPAFPT